MSGNDEGRPLEDGPDAQPNNNPHKSISEAPHKKQHSRWIDSRWRRAHGAPYRVSYEEARAVASVDRMAV